MNQNLFKELASLVPAQLDAGQVFTGTPTGKAVKGYKETCSYTPSVDPRYIFHESARDVVVWFMHELDPLYLYGPTGCGKTTLIKQLAARLNYPTFEVTGHGRLEFADLCGHISLQKGSMVYDMVHCRLPCGTGEFF
ncbi:AAA family ATPase [Bilophila wadsworthia]|jgi:cobaltochelatase CobS|uniref:AAA family ATPase n=1 Tax=Bilophila wadsworthia TaxID=35833 RepID=UPI00266C218A|nr:AAA family ATPase [Bilophila wadsworthia]